MKVLTDMPKFALPGGQFPGRVTPNTPDSTVVQKRKKTRFFHRDTLVSCDFITNVFYCIVLIFSLSSILCV